MESLTDQEVYKLKEEEKPQYFYKKLDSDGYRERFSYVVLQHRDFWFSLGYDKDNKLSFGGNCYTWSNAFSFTSLNQRLVFKMINLHNHLTWKAFKRIVAECKHNPNKLFFCKEDYRVMDKKQQEEWGKKLTWHFYPTEDYNVSKQILYTGMIKDLVELNQYEKEILSRVTE